MLRQINWLNTKDDRTICNGQIKDWDFKTDTFNTKGTNWEPIPLDIFYELRILIGQMFIRNPGEYKQYIWLSNDDLNEKCYRLTRDEYFLFMQFHKMG